MRVTRERHRRLALALVLACAGAAAADPPVPPALEGPKVARPAEQARTLIHRDFDGRLKRLETEPVGAAIAMMELSSSERAAAEKILLDRKADLDAILRDNIPLVMRAQGAFKPGNNGEGQAAVRDLYEKARPVLAKGPLLEQVAAALPKEKADELRRLFNDYMAAAVEDRLASGPAAKKNERFGARIAEGLANFGREVEDSAKRVFEGGDKEFKELVRKLDLTPEQESKVQGMFLDLYANSNGKPSKAQQAGVLLKSMALLTTEQRVRLREIIAQEARDAARARRREKVGAPRRHGGGGRKAGEE
jgi:hypothetical protein